MFQISVSSNYYFSKKKKRKKRKEYQCQGFNAITLQNRPIQQCPSFICLIDIYDSSFKLWPSPFSEAVPTSRLCTQAMDDRFPGSWLQLQLTGSSIVLWPRCTRASHDQPLLYGLRPHTSKKKSFQKTSVDGGFDACKPTLELGLDCLSLSFRWNCQV